tara:strand:- start:62 stop:238 length:177 start_codon:yes stop_codon:yes gene_type:complete
MNQNNRVNERLESKEVIKDRAAFDSDIFDEVITLEPGQTDVVFEDKYGKWPTINVEFD